MMRWFLSIFRLAKGKRKNYDSDNLKKMISDQNKFREEVEQMVGEIFVATEQWIKELKKEVSLDPAKELQIFLTLIPLFIHIHDRVLFDRFGEKVRTLYIESITNRIFEIFKAMAKESNQMDRSLFHNYLNEYQKLFIQYPEIISDLNNLPQSLVWNVTKQILRDIEVREENFELFMYLYMLFPVIIKHFSVNRIKGEV